MLLITGDPPKMGGYPDATAVFDVDAIGLVNIVQVPMWILSGVFFSAQRFPDAAQPFNTGVLIEAARLTAERAKAAALEANRRGDYQRALAEGIRGLLLDPARSPGAPCMV